MYEESEAERYRIKLKDEFGEFVHNQHVYKTLLNFNENKYKGIIDTALYAFHCPTDDLSMQDLKELENYLTIAKHTYFALIKLEPDEINVLISEEEEDPEPNHKSKSAEEIKWKIPRKIPEINISINVNVPQNINHQPEINLNSQNMMPFDPWRSYPLNFTSVVNYQRQQNQAMIISQPAQYMMQRKEMHLPSPGFIFNQSTLRTSQHPADVHNLQFPSTSRHRDSENYNQSTLRTSQHPADVRNLKFPSTSRQRDPEILVPKSYREHKLMKQKEQQRKHEENNRKREEDHKRMQQILLQKKQEEIRQERENNNQKEIQLNQNENQAPRLSDYQLRKQQIENYYLRESQEAAAKSTGSNSKKNKKSLRWADHCNQSLINYQENEASSSKKVPEKLPSSSKASQELNNKSKTLNGKPKTKKKVKNAVNAEDLENFLKVTENPVKVIKTTGQSESSNAKNNVNKKTEISTNNNNKKNNPEKLKELQIIHPNFIISKIPRVSESSKRKSIENDASESKRLKEDVMPNTSNTNVKIKEEPLSDDDNFDGKTEVSSILDNIEKEQQVYSEKGIKLEPDLFINDSISTVENIEIKEEVMSEIDQDGSSINSEKLDVNEITEDFVNICENPDFLNAIAENCLDFSEFANLTENAVTSNNNNDVRVDSQEKCSSWLEAINNCDYSRTTEPSIKKEPVYLSRDEEAETNDMIVSYFPAREFGESEIVPKEEKIMP